MGSELIKSHSDTINFSSPKGEGFPPSPKETLNDSDVDILIGGSLDSSEKLDLAMQLELILKRKVDIVLAAEASCEVLLNAFSKGLPIIINDILSLKKDYFKNFQHFDDRTMLRKIRIARIKSKYLYA